MQEYYFYKTTCTINGKFYYGSGQFENYLGSGKYLIRAIKKYGKENFVTEKLRFFSSREEAFEFEDRFLRLYKISENTNSYNLKNAGLGSSGIIHTEESRRKRSEKLKGRKFSEETRKKMSESKKGNKHWEGKTHSEETKRKISESNKGKTAWNKGRPHPEETRKKLSEVQIGRTSPMKGKKLSEEHRRKLSESLKGTKISEETKQKISEGIKKYWADKKQNKQNNI